MVLILEHVTQEVLFSVAPRGQYAGATIDPERRCGEHQRKGYQGIMYYAFTKNMKLAENRLFERCPCYGNIQHHSNAKSDPGYVYIIVYEFCDPLIGHYILM